MSDTQNRVYRMVYVAEHGHPPYTCERCEQPMQMLEVVHHVDEDRTNSDILNLVAMHDLCHQRHHKLGARHSAETKARIAASLRRAYAEGRHTITIGTGDANPFYGKQHSDEARAKMSATRRRLVAEGKMISPTKGVGHSQATKDKISAAAKARWARRKAEQQC